METCSVPNCQRPKKGLGYCNAHHQRLVKYGDVQAIVPIRPRHHPQPGYLWCYVCELEKPDVEMTAAVFVRSRGWRTGECKECKNRRSPQSPEAGRKHWLNKAYGLSIEQYEERLAQQGGVCAICKSPPRKNRLHVDHDHACCSAPKHSCGRCIRGLLCVSCNSKLEWWIEHRAEVSDYLRQ